MSLHRPSYIPDTGSIALRENAEATLKQILKTASQDLWLDTIRRISGPQHADLVVWMLNQVECDFAVAVHAFYRSNPGQHLNNPQPLPLQPDATDIFALTLLNWDKGYYRSHQLQVEACDAPPRMIRQVRQKAMAHPRGSLPFKLPPRFLAPEGGQMLQLPSRGSPDTADQLWQLYTSLGLQVAPRTSQPRRPVSTARKLLDRVSFRRARR